MCSRTLHGWPTVFQQMKMALQWSTAPTWRLALVGSRACFFAAVHGRVLEAPASAGCQGHRHLPAAPPAPRALQALRHTDAFVTAGSTLLCAGGQLYPEEVSGYVVGKLLAAAEEFAGQPVGKAVISVPAYFTDAQAGWAAAG